MIKFLVLLFKPLPNEAHFEFFDLVMTELTQAGAAVKTLLAVLIPQLEDWFALENANIEWSQKSDLTAFIAQADKRLNHALGGLLARVRASRYSIQPSVAAAAERLYIMLKKHGSIAKKPYLQQVGAVVAILEHLDGDMSADVTAIGLKEWTQETQAALTAFQLLFVQRGEQSLNRPAKTFPAVRKGIEGVWRQIVTLVDSAAAVDTSPDFAAFIQALNPHIESLNKEFHHARHDISTAEPAPIEQQAWTGMPCTPLPEVLYVTSTGTIRLELGKEFNITYKNNINVGNAQCTIHGKGKYKGSKTVTFIIAH
jgi:hypothetical protein